MPSSNIKNEMPPPPPIAAETASAASVDDDQKKKNQDIHGNDDRNNKKAATNENRSRKRNNGGDDDDDDDAGTTATHHECCVDDDCGGDDENILSILPPLTPEVLEEYRRDQELAEEANAKAKLMSRTVHGQLCGIPFCMCIPFVLLIIAVLVGTVLAVITYDSSEKLQPPTSAPTVLPMPTITSYPTEDPA